jgi:hypothetical protein
MCEGPSRRFDQEQRLAVVGRERLTFDLGSIHASRSSTGTRR